MNELKSFEKLKDCLERFPSIGAKSAERIAYNLLEMSDEEVEEFLASIKEAKNKIHHCPNCGLLTEDSLCNVCSSSLRNHSLCILIRDSKEIDFFEKVETFNGVYHVINCNINPTKQETWEKSGLNKLLERVEKENIKEVIFTFGGTIEEEITISIIKNFLQKKGVKVSRIASGIPHGQSLEYLDSVTLKNALEGRIEINK